MPRKQLDVDIVDHKVQGESEITESYFYALPFWIYLTMETFFVVSSLKV